MKLIKIEAKGFKSFAEKIVLNFDGSIVGIAGPNGSGKSNINDAIKWVLGEQSSKSLRGDSMEDVIFSGSKTIKAQNVAQVSLTFDNSDRQVEIPSNKITISRVLERGKGSAYYINGEIGKLKDIKEITMATGISKGSLAIISQGTITEIAQSTSDERRLIFEEVAGILVYRRRKEEALRKLEKTSEALSKMKTIIYELNKQLGPLSRQVEKAKKYMEKSAKLKDVEISLIAEDINYYQNILEKLQKELSIVDLKKEEYEEKISKLTIELDSKTSYKYNLDTEIIEFQAKMDELSNKLLNIESTNSKQEHARKLIISGEMVSSSKEKLKAMYDEITSIGSRVEQFREWKNKLSESIIDKRKNIDEKSKELNLLKIEQNSIKTKKYRICSRLEIMHDYRKNKSNLFQGTRVIINNQSAFPGFEGIVADLINVNKEYQSAIEAILQNSLQNVVVDNSETAVKAIKFLKENSGGRATFIPLNTISPKSIRTEYELALQSQEGYVAIASKLVQTAKRHNILKDFLLGNIIIAKDIDSANYISKLIQKHYMVVTLDGDVIRAGGVLSGGQRSKVASSLINIDQQIKDLELQKDSLQTELSKIELIISTKENLLSEEQALISELYIEQAKVNEKLDMSVDSFDSLKITYESKTNTKIDTVKFKDSKSIDLAQLQSTRSNIQQQLKVKRDKIIKLNQELTSISISKNETEKLLRQLINDSSEKSNLRSKAEFYIKNSLQRLSEEYEMTIQNAIQNYKLKIDKEQARQIVSTLKKEIKELGYINMDSIDQYEEVKTRYDELKKNESELDSAQELILSAIAEMDQIMIVKFEETVNGIQENLQPIFKRMFGGGEIELRYTNPSNLLETGIDVLAQPPGKSIRNLKLFSGGEKSLIAISLLFAILKFKPLPLCILDEVEAALDETNVVRYADFLQELKDKTQFIVITHRIGTMERVDQLFGVTMQQRGVTSIFSVKLEKAREIIDSSFKKNKE